MRACEAQEAAHARLMQGTGQIHGGERRKHDQHEELDGAEDEDEYDGPWSHLTPYVDGYTLYPERAGYSSVPTPVPEIVEASAEAAGDQAEDAVDDKGEDQAEDHDDEEQEDGDDGLVEDNDDQPDDSSPPTPMGPPSPGSLQPDSAQMTAANSPAPDLDKVAIAEAIGAPLDEKSQPPTPRVRKQYKFKNLRDAKEFASVLKDCRDMPTEDLYAALAHVNKTLVAWQNEFNRLRKITDDEDNAVRRRTADAAYEKKLASVMNKPDVNCEEKHFEVKGIRVRDDVRSEPKDYARGQDRIMAQAYGFELDTRESMIGKQDPVEQREGLANSRLRNRPKQTQKAAEAETEDPNIVTGKRTRKKRVLEDGSQAPSRAGTPVASTRGGKAATRGRRGLARAMVFAAEEVDEHGFDSMAEVEPLPPPRKKPGRKSNAQKAAEAAAAAAAAAVAAKSQTQTNGTAIGAKPRQMRKRGRGRRVIADDASVMADEDEDTMPEPPRKRRRLKLTNNSRNGNGITTNGSHLGSFGELAADSFYSTTGASTVDAEATEDEESRPSTAASNGTAETAHSSYSLRQKRPREYQGDDDVQLGTQPRPQPNKRGRRGAAANNATTAAASGPRQDTHTFIYEEPAPARGGAPLHQQHHQSYPSVDIGPSPGHGQGSFRVQFNHAHRNSGVPPPPPPPHHQQQMPFSAGPGPVSANPRRAIKIKNVTAGFNPSPQPTPPQAGPAYGVPPPPPPSAHYHQQGPLPQHYGGVPGPMMMVGPLPPSNHFVNQGVPPLPPLPPNSAQVAAPQAPPQDPAADQKDYASMTKSEKMSHSMKSKSHPPLPIAPASKLFQASRCANVFFLLVTARWANGSMQGAVQKRKATLAAKKAAQAAASSTPPTSTPTPTPGPGRGLSPSPAASNPPPAGPGGQQQQQLVPPQQQQHGAVAGFPGQHLP